jgi:hypothetical protein
LHGIAPHLLSEDGQNFTAVTGTIAGSKALHLELGGARIARYVKLGARTRYGRHLVAHR